MIRRTLALLVTAAALGACVGELQPPRAPEEIEFTGGEALVDLDALAELSARAETAPDDVELQWRAGIAHVRACLQGHVSRQDLAERYLARAHAADPDAYPSARVLARFLNMRSAVLDLERLDLQVTLYAGLLDDTGGRRGALSSASEQDRFHLASFHASGEALAAYAAGRPLAALRRVQRLERAMQTRVRRQQDEIDTLTMAGNFELNFAGIVPVGSAARLKRGNAYLAAQQARWDELSPGARDVEVAPNVRTVFTMMLAEGSLAADDIERARALYLRVIDLADQPQTAPRAQLVALAEHRLAALPRYAGDERLLPPWPNGVTGCVACHSREARLPPADLFILGELPWEQDP